MRKKNRKTSIRIGTLSLKQKKALSWWLDCSPFKDYWGIAAEGAIRSGKTLSLSLSFVKWSMLTFNNETFGMAGKTISSFRRNVFKDLKPLLESEGYTVQEHRTDNLFTVEKNGVYNEYYIFGGKDEASQDLVQGITLAGFFFDEVALMPESFVSQATARCSVEGSKLWFNCNPAGPKHWFKTTYIDQHKAKNILVLHFTLDDNPSLSEQTKERYKSMYTGVFYKRYILGAWVAAEGAIYDMFSYDIHVVPTEEREYTQFYICCDYGTLNPTAFGLWGKCGSKWYKVKEYYYSGRDTNKQLTDEEYYKELENFAGQRRIKSIIIDPSAASFITCIRKHGRFKVKPANNAVLDGIRNVQSALIQQRIAYNDCCTSTFNEFESYMWDTKAAQRGEDKPLKEDDHAMDADRYFINTVLFGPKVSVHIV